MLVVVISLYCQSELKSDLESRRNDRTPTVMSTSGVVRYSVSGLTPSSIKDTLWYECHVGKTFSASNGVIQSIPLSSVAIQSTF